MTTGNVAELKKRFAGMNIIGVLPGKPNIRPRGNSEESSVSDESRSSSTIYSNGRIDEDIVHQESMFF